MLVRKPQAPPKISVKHLLRRCHLDLIGIDIKLHLVESDVLHCVVNATDEFEIPIPPLEKRCADTINHRPVTPMPRRSEEHTSELQSLMRISYAVFCLKKKKQTL